MAQNNPSPQPRVYYGGVPAGHTIPTTVNLPYPLPPQIPVGLQATPTSYYPVSVQMSTQPSAATPTPGAHVIYSGPPPPAGPASIPPADYNLVFRIQPQPTQNPAPGTVIQYVPGAYPDADAVARAQAQAAAQAVQAADVAKSHAAGVALANAGAAGVQYYFGNTPVRAPEPYAYGIITPQPVPRPVSPTDYGSGDPQGRRFNYVRYS
ncbi:hypothetical protein HOY80DRAFT_1134847 [Tuber brumale]|nr:hypothetical protein HOY80DRAFT_1134847 [Tuber brumale]